MPRLTKRSLYASEVHAECVRRIEQLTADARPQWGTMTAAQMLAHCADVLEVTNGAPLRNTPWLIQLLRGLVRKMVLSDKPYPRGSGTHPQYRQTADRDFTTERDRLLKELDRFVHADDRGRAVPHPLFGAMTADEKGWAMYKHLDHHLRQFGS